MEKEEKNKISLLIVALAIGGLFVFLVFFPQSFQQITGSLVEALKGGSFKESNVQYYYEYPEEVEFVLERKLNVEALDGQIKEYTIQATLPKDIPDIQDVIDVQISKEPNLNLKEDFKFVQWQGSNFKGEDSITLTYHIKTKTYQWDVISKDSGTVEDIPEEIKTQYLKDQWFTQDEADFRITPSSEEIKNLAYKITKDKSTVYDKTKVIYNFIEDNIAYTTTETKDLPKSALQTLKDREGDCDDQAILFVSLSRAAGIPARLIAGVVYDSEKEKWSDHVWAQVYIGQDFADIDTVARNFLFRDPFRFTDFVDIGSDEDLDSYYNTFSGTYFESGTKPEFTQSYTTLDFHQTGKIRRIAKID